MRDSRNDPPRGDDQSNWRGTRGHEQSSELRALRFPERAASTFEAMLNNPDEFGAKQISAAINYFIDHFHYVPGGREIDLAMFEEPSSHPGIQNLYKLEVHRSKEDPGVLLNASCKQLAGRLTEDVTLDYDLMRKHLVTEHHPDWPMPVVLDSGRSIRVVPDVLDNERELRFTYPLPNSRQFWSKNWAEYNVTRLAEKDYKQTSIPVGAYLYNYPKLFLLNEVGVLVVEPNPSDLRVGQPGYEVKISADECGVVCVTNTGPSPLAVKVTPPDGTAGHKWGEFLGGTL